jgi:hypothetical protein
MMHARRLKVVIMEDAAVFFKIGVDISPLL